MRGTKVGTLQSSEMGLGIYKKLGFKELFRTQIYAKSRS